MQVTSRPHHDHGGVITAIRLTATYGLFVIVLIAAIAWLRSRRVDKVAMATTFVFAAVIGGGLLLASAMIWDDPRPFAVDGVAPLLPHAPDNGFPSDHTIAASLVAGVVLAFHRRVGILLLGVALCVGAARVATHVHHISDVVGGLLIGLAAAALGTVLARFALNAAKRTPATAGGPRASR